MIKKPDLASRNNLSKNWKQTNFGEFKECHDESGPKKHTQKDSSSNTVNNDHRFLTINLIIFSFYSIGLMQFCSQSLDVGLVKFSDELIVGSKQVNQSLKKERKY